jgi:hypothetical protein
MSGDLDALADPSARAAQMNASGYFADVPDFSLVLGGPVYQLFRRAHLSGDALELLYRRVVAVVLITWVPLLVLALVPAAGGGNVVAPFLHDLEAQTRFLIALPLLIVAELTVHQRSRVVIRRFLDRRLIRPQDLDRFIAAVNWGLRLRNSVVIELGMIAVVWTFGHWLWRNYFALATTGWFGALGPAGSHLTPTGYWYAYVSIPVFQFILLRWYFRFFLWYGLLFRISRLTLHLTATHPDRAGGLAFLGKSAYAFGPILFAQGTLLAGLIATRVLYEGATLLDFKMEAAGMIVFFVVIVLGPLTMFTPQLAYTKRRGLGAYGMLASHYVQGFEEKWIVQNAAEREEILGTGDIQSLADLGNSYSVVGEMRLVPFGLTDITRLAAATAAPLLPLGLTVLSFEDLVVRVFKIVL